VVLLGSRGSRFAPCHCGVLCLWMLRRVAKTTTIPTTAKHPLLRALHLLVLVNSLSTSRGFHLLVNRLSHASVLSCTHGICHNNNRWLTPHSLPCSSLLPGFGGSRRYFSSDSRQPDHTSNRNRNSNKQHQGNSEHKKRIFHHKKPRMSSFASPSATSSSSSSSSSSARSLPPHTIPLSEKEQILFDIIEQTLQHTGRRTVPRVAGGWVRDKLLGGKPCVYVCVRAFCLCLIHFCVCVRMQWTVTTSISPWTTVPA
jgi:hypothetical protein